MQQLHCQEYHISKYEKNDHGNDGLELLKKFQVENKESLILKYTNEDYLVFENQDVYKINYIPSEDILVFKIRLKDELKKICFQIIDSLKKINPDYLNITKKEDGTEMTVQDGYDYKLELYKSNAKILYTTYAPEGYIEHKFPHFQERKIILNSFINLKKIFYDEEIEKIMSLRNIYIIVENENEYNKIKIESKIFQKLSITDFIFSDSKTLTFLNTNEEYIRKKDLYKNHENEIITFDIINKYRYKKSLNFLSGNKTIYLVFMNEKKCKKILLKTTSLRSYEL